MNEEPVARKRTMTNDDLNQIRQSIEGLGNRMSDQFDRVRNEMQLAMQAYVLNAVHQKDMERLNEKDNKQQDQIDALQAKLDGMMLKVVTITGGVTGTIATILAILHYAHFI